MIKTYLIYLARWQLSTPILTLILMMMARHTKNKWVAAAIANLVGGLIFFWIDRIIFGGK
jgi:lipoprotein signal peptidase